jgi:hypothetical protein
MTASAIPVRSLIAIPAIITLAITFVRLVGELMQLSPAFFSRAGGGAGAIVGIVWLAPLFGGYFAIKLLHVGDRPANFVRAFGLLIVALVMAPLIAVVFARAGLSGNLGIVVVCFALLAAGFVAKAGWPGLGRVLFAYGLAARIPVVLVMLMAILGDWGTHYDIAPPNFSYTNPLLKWLLIGVLPQLTLWVGFTVVSGMAVGLVTAAIHGRKH